MFSCSQLKIYIWELRCWTALRKRGWVFWCKQDETSRGMTMVWSMLEAYRFKIICVYASSPQWQRCVKTFMRSIMLMIEFRVPISYSTYLGIGI